MSVEFELKYSATPEILTQIHESFPGGTVIPMETVYYDTPDGALSKKRWTLRHRTEGSLEVCTLKTPGADGISRGEWECCCSRIEDAVPVLADASKNPELLILAQQGLIISCGAKFTRIAIPITAGSSTAELALDSGLLRNGTCSVSLCECEVELKSGGKEDILAFAEDLARKFHLHPEPKSKFARAKALSQEDRHGI